MRHSPVTHSKLNKIYFLPILGVIIVYGGRMLWVERLYLRQSRFKYGRFLAKFPLNFPSVLTEPLSLRIAVKLKETAVKIRGL